MKHTLWQSFQYAGRGLRDAFRSQRTMRIHVLLVCAVVVVVVWLGLSVVETALLVLCMAAVLAAELMNTAVEAVVDLQVGENQHILAGRAKDFSAAGVLVMAAGAAVVGLVVLGPPVAAAVGAGDIHARTLVRAGTLLAVLAVLVVAVGRAGARATDEERGSRGTR
jgi:diacylglycerol kinase (ATP)